MTEQVLAVQRMQDYIEKNKTEEISLSDLARASLYSPWYALSSVPGLPWSDTDRVYPEIPAHTGGKAASWR